MSDLLLSTEEEGLLLSAIDQPISPPPGPLTGIWLRLAGAGGLLTPELHDRRRFVLSFYGLLVAHYIRALREARAAMGPTGIPPLPPEIHASTEPV